MSEVTLPDSFKAQLEEAAAPPEPVAIKPKTKTLIFKGTAFQVPSKLPVAFMAQIEAEHPSLAAKALLGEDQWERFLAMDPDADDLEAFYRTATRTYGLSGN